ncbi:MAG: mechanosensitive ion channel family protein [Lysobacterales bacterium]|nr:MAG: mechanosensitive ion channel family protein [Xanthomonadales bacterium]
MLAVLWASFAAASLLFSTPCPAGGATPAAVQTQSPPDLRLLEEDTPTALVSLDGHAIFRVRGVSAFPADERARAIEERLRAFARHKARSVDELRLVSQANATLILAGTERIATVLDADASLEHIDRNTLAEVNLARMKEAVERYRADRAPAYLLRHAVYAVIGTLLLAGFVFGVRRLDRWFEHRVEARYGRVLAEFEGRSKSLVRAQWIASVLRWSVSALAMLLVVAGILAWLGFVLELFPWTRPTGVRMVALFTAPLAAFGRDVVAALPGLAFLVVLYAITRALLRFLRMAFSAVQSGSVRFEEFDPDWAEPTYKIVRLLVVVLALVVAYPYVPGSGSEAFKGISLLLGVMFSLGSSSIISNMIAGYTMTYRRAFRRGDLVRVGEAIGFVTNMRLQVTHLRNMRNEEIIVPNSEILGSTVINYTSLGRSEGLMITTTVGIGYETPWRQVESMLLLAAERTTGVRREPKSFVLVTQLGDFCVSYDLYAPIEDPGTRMTTLAALNRNVLDVFNEYGVQIMTPAYEGDPAVPKVVPRDQWYAAPAVAPAGSSRSTAPAE